MPLVDLFDGQVKVEVCRTILETFSRLGHVTSDAEIINGLFYVGRVVHDSVNAVSFADEQRQVSILLTNLVRKVVFLFCFFMVFGGCGVGGGSHVCCLFSLICDPCEKRRMDGGGIA